MYQTILNALYLVIAFSFVIALIFNKWRYALIIFIAAIPLKHVYITIAGHYLELWKLLSLVSLPITLRYFLIIYSRMQHIRLLFIYLILALMSSFTGPLVVSLMQGIPEIDLSLRTIFTQLVQLVSFLNLSILPLALSAYNPITLKQAFIAYILVTFLLAVLGLLQYLVYQTGGVNIFPIPRIGEDVQEEVLLNYIGDVRTEGLFRVTSLSMEPKNLAFYLAASMIFLYELRQAYARPVFSQLFDVVAILVMFLCLMLTYSSLGLAVLGAYVLILLIFKLQRAFFLTILFIIVFFLLSVTGMMDLFVQIIGGRLFDRIAVSGGMEDFDIATWDFFTQNPILIFTGIGLGNTHIVASDYLPWFAEWAYGTRWHAKMGWLYVLAGSGVLGFTFLLSAFWVGIRYLKKVKSNYEILTFVQAVLPFFAVLYFIRQNELAFLMLGCATAICFQTNFARSNKKSSG